MPLPTHCISSVQFSRSVMSDSAIPWTAAYQVSLSITNSRSSLKLMCIESVMPSNHLILCHPLLLLPSIFPSIKGLFQWVSSSHQVAKVLEFQFQHLTSVSDCSHLYFLSAMHVFLMKLLNSSSHAVLMGCHSGASADHV